MDVRRLNSTPLADTSREVFGNFVAAPSPYGSPKEHSGRLPALWKSLKSKLESFRASRSANNLPSLATAAPDACPSPSLSPPSQALAFCSDGLTQQSQCSPPQHLSLSESRPDCELARLDEEMLGVRDHQKAAKDVYGTSSANEICRSQNVLSTGASSSGVSSITTKARNKAEAPLPSILPAAALQVDNYDQTQNRVPQVIADAAPSTHLKLLAVSPALPRGMRRTVWTLKDYSVQRRIFKGSSSAVYKGTCLLSGLPVALKVYFLSRVPANVVHMLKREIEIQSQLVHRHVARLYGAFMDEGDRVVLVQEYAAQGDLYGILQRLGGRMSPGQVSELVMRPTLEALSYLHSRGVCHRDVKPENILFTKSWRLLVADFGVSIDLNQERAVTRAGTEGYMAPEVARCPLKVEPHDNKDNQRYAYSPAVDIWAAGVMAYELLVGFPPIVMSAATAAAIAADPPGASNAVSVSQFIQSHMNPASLHFPASVPPAARAFVLAALAPDPLERPTAAQFLCHPWLQPKSAVATAAAVAAATTPVEVVASEAVGAFTVRAGGSFPGDLRFREMRDLVVS